MNVDVSKVLQKLQTRLAEAITTIAVLESQIEALEEKLGEDVEDDKIEENHIAVN